jgi:hypothetical protein
MEGRNENSQKNKIKLGVEQIKLMRNEKKNGK